MRKSISEMAKISGVSVRTLHYYDEIGLLKPKEVILETGYRYYNEEDMSRLQQILFYRELDFSLKEIVRIMNSSDYNKEEALQKQRELLLLKKKRLSDIIRLLDANLKGETTMSFREFDTTKLEEERAKYAQEAKEKWGGTDAYKENQKKTAGYSAKDWESVTEAMDELLKKFSVYVGQNPDSAKVQELVEEWRQYITKNWYECTKEVLAGLGQMYVADERFMKNMDKFKEGTAKLISEAIACYCKSAE